MVVHIALFRWKKGTAPATIDKILDDIRVLKGKVPGVQSISSGENYSKWSEGYTHAVVVFANNQSALDGYRNHPDHLAVNRQIEAIEEKSLGVDFHE